MVSVRLTLRRSAADRWAFARQRIITDNKARRGLMEVMLEKGPGCRRFGLELALMPQSTGFPGLVVRDSCEEGLVGLYNASVAPEQQIRKFCVIAEINGKVLTEDMLTEIHTKRRISMRVRPPLLDASGRDVVDAFKERLRCKSFTDGEAFAALLKRSVPAELRVAERRRKKVSFTDGEALAASLKRSVPAELRLGEFSELRPGEDAAEVIKNLEQLVRDRRSYQAMRAIATEDHERNVRTTQAFMNEMLEQRKKREICSESFFSSLSCFVCGPASRRSR